MNAPRALGSAQQAAKILHVALLPDVSVSVNKHQASPDTNRLPTIQKDATAVTTLPRISFGLHSLAKLNNGGTVAPIPIPAMNLNTVNSLKEGVRKCIEDNVPAVAFVNKPIKRAGLLPIVSDKNPRTVPPKSIPRKIDDAKYLAPSMSEPLSSW